MDDPAQAPPFFGNGIAGNNPADDWIYRGQGFGAFLEHLANVRGGSRNPHSVGLRVFRARAMPRLRK